MDFRFDLVVESLVSCCVESVLCAAVGVVLMKPGASTFRSLDTLGVSI